MQALQERIMAIIRRLGELSPTARLLVASTMVILVMALFLVSLYAGRNSLASLGLSQSLSSESRAQAISYLEQRDIPHEIRGGDIMVPRDQKYTILAQLTDTEVITASGIDFDSLVSDDSPFLSKAQNQQRWQIAKMNVVKKMLVGMSGIAEAEVIFDNAPNAGGIGRSHTPPSASVMILPSGGALTQNQVDAIVRIVSGAQVGLKPKNVSVVDARTGRSMEARSDDIMHASTNMELQQSHEKILEDKIGRALDYITGVRVAVKAAVDTRQEQQRSDTYEEPKSGVLEESSRTTTSLNGGGAMTVGVQPNTGAAIPSTAGGGSETSDERTAARMTPRFPRTERSILDPKGYALKINASIQIPKAYFVRVYQDEQGDENAAPDATQLDAVVQSETTRIRQSIEPLIDSGPLENAVAGMVTVNMIPDIGLAAIGGGGMAGSSGGGVVGGTEGGIGGGMALGGWIQNAGVAVLGLISVFMMFLLVRKASVREALPTAEELAGMPPPLAVNDSDLVGEADESVPVMEGLEIDENVMRQQQKLEQINAMAKESPDVGAALLRKWIRDS